MKTTNIPGFTAEASLGSVGSFRTRRANKETLAIGTVRPALPRGGGGLSCAPDEPNCVDCNDDVENIVCAECNAGGTLQCCDDPESCEVNLRQTVDCTDPVTARTCWECGQGGPTACCFLPTCNIIPSTALPPNCFRLGGRVICNFGIPITLGNLASTFGSLASWPIA